MLVTCNEIETYTHTHEAYRTFKSDSWEVNNNETKNREKKKNKAAKTQNSKAIIANSHLKFQERRKEKKTSNRNDRTDFFIIGK